MDGLFGLLLFYYCLDNLVLCHLCSGARSGRLRSDVNHPVPTFLLRRRQPSVLFPANASNPASFGPCLSLLWEAWLSVSKSSHVLVSFLFCLSQTPICSPLAPFATTSWERGSPPCCGSTPSPCSASSSQPSLPLRPLHRVSLCCLPPPPTPSPPVLSLARPLSRLRVPVYHQQLQ